MGIDLMILEGFDGPVIILEEGCCRQAVVL